MTLELRGPRCVFVRVRVPSGSIDSTLSWNLLLSTSTPMKLFTSPCARGRDHEWASSKEEEGDEDIVRPVKSFQTTAGRSNRFHQVFGRSPSSKSVVRRIPATHTRCSNRVQWDIRPGAVGPVSSRRDFIVAPAALTSSGTGAEKEWRNVHCTSTA
jgi:hypothetical protein